jgi:4-hydroxybenzoate polyprenyltransferase
MSLDRERRLQWGERLKRYALLCRLDRPADLPLLLLPALWASLLATDGNPDGARLALLLLGATLMRCAAWVFNDWMEARWLPQGGDSCLGRGLVAPHELRWLLATLLFAALLLLLPLPAVLFYYAWAAPLLLVAIPLVKTRLQLIQPYLGLCHAWLVPMAYAAQGVHPDKAGWLLFTATLLWASAFSLLRALPRREYELRVGIGSLAHLFGRNSWLFILTMQLGAVFSLWLAGRQLELGIFYSLGLIVLLLLIPYQQWLLFSHPDKGPLRSYYSQIWSAIALLCGIAFHYLCTC